MSTLETLKAARKLITPKKRWTQGAWARGKSGRSVATGSKYAVCFCASGAIWKSCQDSPTVHQAHRGLAPFTGNIATFNDSHTHAEVLRAFDEAIAKLEAQ